MKKSLLLLAIATGAVTVQAQESASPEVMTDITVQAVSHDGKYILSNPYGILSIINLETGKRWNFLESDSQGRPTGFTYSPGLGNVISKSGKILFSFKEPSTACYWQEGEWYPLRTDGCIGTSMTNSITPDDSRICGSMYLSQPEFSSRTMLLPVYWDAEGDGYGMYHKLPCPATDFTGRAPQYITALDISADGNTIAGQIVDYSGGVCEPIIYTRGADGEWSYSMPMDKVFRPEGMVWPSYPDKMPDLPDVTDYMTDEQMAAYNAQMDIFRTTYNPDDYPDAAEYLSEEGRLEYNKAVDEWNALAEEHNNKLDEFYAVWSEFIDDIPYFEFNNVRISPDGRYLNTALCEIEDPTDPWAEEISYVARLDVNTGEYTVFHDYKDMILWSMLDDGRITIGTPATGLVFTGYIEGKDGKFVNIYDYITALNPDYGAWMKENMTHNVPVDYDPETEDIIYEEVMVTGVPVASGDGSKILTWTPNTWDNSYYKYLAYYFDLGDNSSADNMAADTSVAEVTGYEVYDVNGRMMLKTADKAAIGRENLAGGVYIVKTLLSNGWCNSEKIVIRGN